MRWKFPFWGIISLHNWNDTCKLKVFIDRKSLFVKILTLHQLLSGAPGARFIVLFETLNFMTRALCKKVVYMIKMLFCMNCAVAPFRVGAREGVGEQLFIKSKQRKTIFTNDV